MEKHWSGDTLDEWWQRRRRLKVRSVEEAGLRTVWVQQRRDKSWRVCAKGMQLVRRSSESSNSHVRRGKKRCPIIGFKDESYARVFSWRGRETKNDINGITWGIGLQSGRRKDFILILGGSNLQMRSWDVLVLTGAQAIAGCTPHAVNNVFCSDMDGSDYCGWRCPAHPAATVHSVKRDCSNKWIEATGAPPLHCHHPNQFKQALQCRTGGRLLLATGVLAWCILNNDSKSQEESCAVAQRCCCSSLSSAGATQADTLVSLDRGETSTGSLLKFASRHCVAPLSNNKTQVVVGRAVWRHLSGGRWE